MKVDVRSFIIAPENKVLLACDYAGQELRVLAHVAQEPTMIDAFLKNQDVHLLLANDFYDLNIPDEHLITSHPKYSGVKNSFKTERNNIKTVNFGLAYGKTKYGFAADFGWSVDMAEAFINKYFDRFPKIKEAIEKCSDLVRKQKAIRNLTGRIRRFDHVDDRVLRQAFNFCIQGASADMMKIAAGNTYELCLEYPEWDCKLVLSVHDELVYEIKEEYIEEALPLVKDTMESAVELVIPMVVDIGYSKDYSEAKI
jgi:DNA polymerase-1